MTASDGGRSQTDCGNRHEDDNVGWLLLCTLPTGHQGDHQDDEVGKTWSSDHASSQTPS